MARWALDVKPQSAHPMPRAHLDTAPVAQASQPAVPQVSKLAGLGRTGAAADLEVGDTAGLETCATTLCLKSRLAGRGSCQAIGREVLWSVCAPAEDAKGHSAHEHKCQRAWLRRDSVCGKADVVQFGPARSGVIEHRSKCELPGLTRIRRYIDSIDRVALSCWRLPARQHNRRQRVAVKRDSENSRCWCPVPSAELKRLCVRRKCAVLPNRSINTDVIIWWDDSRLQKDGVVPVNHARVDGIPVGTKYVNTCLSKIVIV
jgi:hypothetical protein